MTEENILATPKPSTITLADGKEYILPAMTLNVMANIEEELGFGIDKLQEQFITKFASTTRKVLCSLLRVNYPDMTLEKVGSLVTMEELPVIVEKVVNITSNK